MQQANATKAALQGARDHRKESHVSKNDRSCRSEYGEALFQAFSHQTRLQAEAMKMERESG